jgi:hypothetical protein
MTISIPIVSQKLSLRSWRLCGFIICVVEISFDFAQDRLHSSRKKRGIRSE